MRLIKPKQTTIEIKTLSGDLSIPAIYGLDSATNQWINPLRIRLGLGSKKACSPELVERLCYTAAQSLSYESCARIAQKWGVDVCDSTVQQHVCREGARIQALRDEQVEEALEPRTRLNVVAQAARQCRGEEFSLIIMLDGWMIRERGAQWGWKPPEDQAARVEWHEMKTGIVFRVEDQAKTQSDRGVILRKFYEAWRGDAQDFSRRLYALALRQGLHQARHVFVVADGGIWIWNIVEERFGGAHQLLDFYHASQHLHEVAQALHEDGARAKQWVEPLLHQLKHGGEAGVIKTLEQLASLIEQLDDDPAKTVERNIHYFQEHRERLHYSRMAAMGCPMGSGAMESTCSQLQDRFKRTGQFWTQAGAAHLMTLEIVRRNGEWEFFW